MRTGITNLNELRQLGSVAAFAKVKQAGEKPSLNLLWALEGALSGEHWQTVAKEHRASLLLALELHVHEISQSQESKKPGEPG